jgi:hypothetical protein
MARAAVACILVLLLPGFASSGEQAPSDLVAGMRVRVTAPGVAIKPVVGTIQSLSADAIELAVKGREGTMLVPRASVLQLEVSRGPNRALGILVGGAVVAAMGAAVGAIGCRDSSDFDSWHCAAILGGAGFALGGGMGAITGMGEQWKELPGERLRVTLGPGRGCGLGLSMRFSF